MESFFKDKNHHIKEATKKEDALLRTMLHRIDKLEMNVVSIIEKFVELDNDYKKRFPRKDAK
jgi:hypothetical protein